MLRFFITSKIRSKLSDILKFLVLMKILIWAKLSVLRNTFERVILNHTAIVV